MLVDSDTLWTEGTLRELVKPFANRKVGGVTTNQRIVDPHRNVLTRWSDWLENVRVQYSMPAMSVLGQVGCLPGRTIAFRKFILEEAMDPFLNEKFMGVFLEVSDDRTLTNLCLKQGYRTVYQSTSCVLTDTPVGMRKLAKQQLRWARGSQYNTLRMLPWMLKNAPVLALFYVTDIIMPFLLLACATGFVVRMLDGENLNFYEGITFGYGAVVGTGLIVVLTIIATVDLRVRAAGPPLRRTSGATCCSCRCSRCSTRSCSCRSASTGSCAWPRTTAGARARTRSTARRAPKPATRTPSSPTSSL